jgi:hypothetical protein
LRKRTGDDRKRRDAGEKIGGERRLMEIGTKARGGDTRPKG